MSKTEEMQAKMLNSIEEKTSLKPEVIIEDIKFQNLEKHNLKIKYVKEKYGLSHGFANLLVLKSKENSNTINLVAGQYTGKENLLPIYTAIKNFLETFEDVEFVSKKAYVSVKTKKQFAIIQPSTKTRIDIGLKFPKGIIIPIEPSESFNSMVTHRIRIESMNDFNLLTKEYLKKAYDESL